MTTEAVSLATVREQSAAAGDTRAGSNEIVVFTRIADLLECIRYELIALRTSIDKLSEG